MTRTWLFPIYGTWALRDLFMKIVLVRETTSYRQSAAFSPHLSSLGPAQYIMGM